MARPPALASPRPPRPSSTPSSTVQRKDLPGPTTFRGSPSLALTPPSCLQQPSWEHSPDSLGLRPQPSLRACFLARLLPLVQYLPARLMWFPLGTLCRLRKARFKLVLFFMLSAALGKGFSIILVLISRPYVGLGPLRTPVEENCSGYFLC